VKEAFATEVVENSRTKPTEIIKDPAGVLGEYWYTNLKGAVDFLDDAVAVNGMFFMYFSLSCQWLKDIYNSRRAQTGSHSPAVSGVCCRQCLCTHPQF
jgi:hypothetical protein